MRAVLSIVAGCIAVTLGACNQPSGAGAVKPQAGYEFEVRGAGESHTKGHAATFSVQAGANSAEVKDGKLIVNGKPYGTVADGATIIVEENGKVSVNGKERLPE